MPSRGGSAGPRCRPTGSSRPRWIPSVETMHEGVGGPLARELLEIAQRSRDMPATTTRRHHYVPAFLLARFAEPAGDRRGWLYQLDTSTGEPQKTTPDAACFERDLYAALSLGARKQKTGRRQPTRPHLVRSRSVRLAMRDARYCAKRTRRIRPVTRFWCRSDRSRAPGSRRRGESPRLRRSSCRRR